MIFLAELAIRLKKKVFYSLHWAQYYRLSLKFDVIQLCAINQQFTHLVIKAHSVCHSYTGRLKICEHLIHFVIN